VVLMSECVWSPEISASRKLGQYSFRQVLCMSEVTSFTLPNTLEMRVESLVSPKFRFSKKFRFHFWKRFYIMKSFNVLILIISVYVTVTGHVTYLMTLFL
jgi:hypothetical protein